MKKPTTSNRPLKAYHITWFADEIPGLFLGTSHGQARAAFARSPWTEGVRSGRNPELAWTRLRARRCRDAEAERLAVEEHEDGPLYWRDRRRTRRLQAECDAWNAAHPVGTPVRILSDEARHWPDGQTRTRTPAWLASETAILVSVEGYAGGFYLKYVQPLTAAEVTAQPLPIAA